VIRIRPTRPQSIRIGGIRPTRRKPIAAQRVHARGGQEEDAVDDTTVVTQVEQEVARRRVREEEALSAPVAIGDEPEFPLVEQDQEDVYKQGAPEEDVAPAMVESSMAPHRSRRVAPTCSTPCTRHCSENGSKAEASLGGFTTRKCTTSESCS
jgi:hypothetical protein